MNYFTIKDEARDEFEEKKSAFICNIKRVYGEEEARTFINKIKSENREATHNVYAYIIGANKGIQRYSDDGEPQGTAGIPVLEVLKKNDITDVVVVVTRYFGGTLLGAGGLVRAYSKGASIAIKKGGIVEKVKGLALSITIDYDLLGKVQYLCNDKDWYIEDIEYFEKVKLKLLCEASIIDNIEKEVTEVTSGKAIIVKEKEELYFKCENRLFEDI